MAAAAPDRSLVAHRPSASLTQAVGVDTTLQHSLKWQIEMTERAKRAQSDEPARHTHAHRLYVVEYGAAAFERAAALFRAVGEVSRLRLLHQIDAGEWCVTELAAASATKLSTVSQQLRILHAQRLVKRRRSGKHIYYSLADEHVRGLVRAALDHASEPPSRLSSRPKNPSVPKGKKSES